MSIEGGSMFKREVSPEDSMRLHLYDAVTTAKRLIDEYDLGNYGVNRVTDIPEDVRQMENKVETLRLMVDRASEVLDAGDTEHDGPTIVPDMSSMIDELQVAYMQAKEVVEDSTPGMGSN